MSEKNNVFRVLVDSNVLISAMGSEKSLYDFHTPEIQEYFAVYTPADFLKNFNNENNH